MKREVRRLVTGRNAAGRSVVLRDDAPVFVERSDGREWAALWSLPAGPLDPESGRVPPPDETGAEAGAGTILWRVVRLGPSADPAEAARPGGGVDRRAGGVPDRQDWVTVLSGAVDLVLDRERVRLTSGDCVIQCGAPHAWRAAAGDGGVLGILSMAVTEGGMGPTPVGPRRSRAERGVGPRRIVTSRDADGRSFVVHDGEPPNVLVLEHGAGMAYSDIWQTLGPVHTADAGGDTPAGPFEFYALGGGAAWKHMVIPPDAALAGVDAERLAAEYAERAPGMAEGGHHDPDRPGRHRTDSIDLLQILSGRITLVLDEDEVDLAPGDFVVQRGTWHAWSNRTDEPCVFQAMMISTGPLPP